MAIKERHRQYLSVVKSICYNWRYTRQKVKRVKLYSSLILEIQLGIKCHSKVKLFIRKVNDAVKIKMSEVSFIYFYLFIYLFWLWAKDFQKANLITVTSMTSRKPRWEKTMKEVSVLDVGGKPQRSIQGKSHMIG